MPAKFACIYWDAPFEDMHGNDIWGAYNVICAYTDKDIDDDIYWEKWSEWDTFNCCGGNSYAGFGTTGKNELGSCYASTYWAFSKLIGEYGFYKEQEYYRALYEFGRIAEYDFVRKMLKQEIGRILGLYESNHLYIPQLIQLAEDINNGVEIEF